MAIERNAGRDQLALRDRSVVTVVALMAQELVDSSFQYHLMSAKKNGVTKQEITEILTHAAFYVSWPKAWAAFKMAKDVWTDDETPQDTKAAHAASMAFSIGQPSGRRGAGHGNKQRMVRAGHRRGLCPACRVRRNHKCPKNLSPTFPPAA